MEAIIFSSGSTVPTAGETITGATSGKTCIYVSCYLTGGSWAGNDAAGTLYVHTVSGAFQAENLNGSIALGNFATAAGDAAAEFTATNLARLLTGDTDSTYPLFTDNEIEGLMAKFGWVAAGPSAEVDPDFFKVIGWALRSLSCDPDTLMEMKNSTSGGVGLAELMEQYAKRGDVILG